MAEKNPDAFDVVVIGAGPGGYIAAVRAAQLGFRTACVEEWVTPSGEPALGGTCLNVGCIPSKALLASSGVYEGAQHHMEEHGVSVGKPKLDLAAMLRRKDSVVGKMTKGVEFLFKKNRIEWLKGHGRITGRTDAGVEVVVEGSSGARSVQTKHLIIATGSRARHLPGIPVDNVLVCDNEGALNFDSVPKKLTVIGSGVIGLELGSVWRRLGAEVTVLEAMPTFLGACDEAVAKEAAKIFRKQGLQFQLGVKVGQIDVDTAKRKVRVAYTDSAGAAQVLDSDRLIVSVGRVPSTANLGLESVGLKADERGFIPVDDHCATSVPGIWAVGDVVRGPMLAHKAEDEGVMVAELIAGQKPHIDYNCVPWVIYTHPEIAWVGKTEAQLKQDGRAFRTGQIPFLANGRAVGMGETDGFVKMIADAATDEILGVHIIGNGASDLIAEAVVAMEFRASSEDIARICHPHPSLSEVMREAALAVDKRALNF